MAAKAGDPERTRTAELIGIPQSSTRETRHAEAARAERTREITLLPSAAAAVDGIHAAKTVSAPQTEARVPEPLDAAAVHFARERERALSRLDHTAAVRRLARVVAIGVPVWLGGLISDYVVTEIAHEGSFTSFLAIRVAGTLVALGAFWRLRRSPEPSVRVLWFCDLICFTLASAFLSCLAMISGGLTSAYAPGVLVILMARSAATFAPWQQGIWLFAGPVLAHPAVVLIAAELDPMIAAQLHDPHAQARFVAILYSSAIGWAMFVLAGHYAWQLRREAIETRNIGRYKLLRRLGSGGGGDVWAAFDTTLRQRVALKTVSGHRPGSLVLARLEREVRALAELTHPNTVRIFDYGATEDGLWYYAMELLHGETLRELVMREGPLAPERLTAIAQQVLRALGEAHEKGIIHRDIKPENVFVAQVGGEVDFVKLLDFGIARSSGDTRLTNTGCVAGTPAYMAPETILGHPAGVRADIYSFGVTLYFALTARLPFQDEDPAALFAAHLNRPLEPMSLVTGVPIPPALERVVQRCMAKDPAQRYASTRALLEELHAPGLRAPTCWS